MLNIVKGPVIIGGEISARLVARASEGFVALLVICDCTGHLKDMTM
jgi:hypothetical protein